VLAADIARAYRAARALGRVNELLADVYSPEGVHVWLTARNRNLGHASPLERILDDFGDMVIAEAERLAAS
jgi:hypothetical protein